MEDRSGMRPKIGDSSVSLPITFDYSGGRSEKSKSAKVWSIILSAISVIIFLGLLFGGSRPWYTRILLAFGFAFIFSLFLRFIMFKETSKKAEYKECLATDYQLDWNKLWGIYKVEKSHPYICRFRNGKSGVFVRLNKDIILGKYSEAEYNHYEAIADAYNIAGSGKVQMVHVDYMDSVGTDDRLSESLISLSNVENPDLKDLLVDIYTYQQKNMSNRVTSFDTYVFLWSGNDKTAWDTISRILNCFLDANFRSYQLLDEYNLRDFTKTLFNLEDFSVNDACSHAFSDKGVCKITPISIIESDGSITKLNKTTEEKHEEQRQKLEEQRALEREAERKKKEKKSRKKKKKDDSNDADLFKDMF